MRFARKIHVVSRHKSPSSRLNPWLPTFIVGGLFLYIFYHFHLLASLRADVQTAIRTLSEEITDAIGYDQHSASANVPGSTVMYCLLITSISIEIYWHFQHILSQKGEIQTLVSNKTITMLFDVSQYFVHSFARCILPASIHCDLVEETKDINLPRRYVVEYHAFFVSTYFSIVWAHASIRKLFLRISVFFTYY